MLTTIAGCQTPAKNTAGPPRIDASTVETRDDIVEIIQYWPQLPWIQESTRITGFRTATYFVTTDRKGAFVGGTILAWVYVLEPAPDGEPERKLVHMWELDEAESMGFRVTKRALGGFYYGFILRWPNELHLEGRDIEIRFGYERKDKQMILGDVRQMRVPVPAGYRPAKAKAGG